jgi:glycosyltransferase involved in cell wall biosynthesis
MARGLPVVATAAGGLADLVRHGANGLLVAPDDLTDMRGALERLRDPELRARFSVDARETAQRYLWPALAPRFEALLTGEGAC